jgi:hypothetical protein
LIERGVSHEIHDGALLLKTRMVQIPPVFYADQVWYLDGITPAYADAWAMLACLCAQDYFVPAGVAAPPQVSPAGLVFDEDPSAGENALRHDHNPHTQFNTMATPRGGFDQTWRYAPRPGLVSRCS